MSKYTLSECKYIHEVEVKVWITDLQGVPAPPLQLPAYHARGRGFDVVEVVVPHIIPTKSAAPAAAVEEVGGGAQHEGRGTEGGEAGPRAGALARCPAGQHVLVSAGSTRPGVARGSED